MNIDLEQFHGVFFEETGEHIDTMETLLMDLDMEQPDPELVGGIFRAAHSIKGGSGTFGFSALTDLTHLMENLLDQVRKGQREITRALIDLLLQGLDTLRLVVDSYRSGQEVDEVCVKSLSASLQTMLNTSVSVNTGNAPVVSSSGAEDYGLFEETSAAKSADIDAAYGFFSDPEVQQNVEDGSRVSTPNPQRKTINQNDSSTIRVDTDKIDALINLVGELVITQSMLKVLGGDPNSANIFKITKVLSELERNTREIQESVMSIRMIPVSFVFNRFPRVVRDLANKMGKNVDLILHGTQTELDKGLIEKLVDPLTHLVRNSIDHGIERPDVRLAKGKQVQGKITISASQRGGSILISISDDGAGLNRTAILAKAKEVGISIDSNAPDEEVWNLIFQPGFSTAEAVTDVSGRGVGMDVVRRNIQQMGGRVEVNSLPEVGSTFTIQLPLTLAIVDGMGVSVGGQTFIIPLVSIIESMQPLKKNLKPMAGSSLLHVREEYWPLLSLARVMNVNPRYPDPDKGIVVLIETTKRRYGLIVDELLGQQQVVIKSLEQHYRRVPGTAGATIMGDGSVALILDVESLADIVPVSLEIELEESA